MLHNTDLNQLIHKLEQAMPGLGGSQIRAYAERMISETDERLEPNVNEWLHDEILTDIWIDQYCIGLVMKIQGRGDFLGALEAINTYASDPIKGERMIWRVTQ